MCPDSAIIVEEGKLVGFNMEHCKGCGICAVECPDKINAILMEEEAD
jgi:pyruvate ferredoxin oxidoreductase delta subunit